MYITISPQKIGPSYATSVSDFVDYLEKENSELFPEKKEYFFDQTHDQINPNQVIKEIDGNTAKLKTSEPRYYSLTINPSQRELQHIGNNPEKLKAYTREIMKDYASSFNRKINNRPVQVTDIKYYGKVEFTRTYKGTDKEIRENMPFSNRLAKLENDLRKIDQDEIEGSQKLIRKEMRELLNQAPHKLDGKLIEQGMQKPGVQTHIHLIVSRKDISNSVSLSPGSKYKSSEVIFQGKTVKRGFDRDSFYQKAEKSFDRKFNFKRNYAEQYASRKLLIKAPKQFYLSLLKLPTSERKLAFQLLRSTHAVPVIPNAQVRYAIKQLHKALEVGMKSGSIGY